LTEQTNLDLPAKNLTTVLNKNLERMDPRTSISVISNNRINIFRLTIIKSAILKPYKN